jgi:hypothetical protein
MCAGNSRRWGTPHYLVIAAVSQILLGIGLFQENSEMKIGHYFWLYICIAFYLISAQYKERIFLTVSASDGGNIFILTTKFVR